MRDSARAYFDEQTISWWLSNDERAERKKIAIKEKLPTIPNSHLTVCPGLGHLLIDGCFEEILSAVTR